MLSGVNSGIEWEYKEFQIFGIHDDHGADKHRRVSDLLTSGTG
jgi:hypothetical protein